jgi:hypothetical protein
VTQKEADLNVAVSLERQLNEQNTCHNAAQNPSNWPSVPSLLNSLKALCCQLRKPYASPLGLPPTIVMKVKEKTIRMRMTWGSRSQYAVEG